MHVRMTAEDLGSASKFALDFEQVKPFNYFISNQKIKDLPHAIHRITHSVFPLVKSGPKPNQIICMHQEFSATII